MYAIQARKHIATLRNARLDVVIDIRWLPAHKWVPGNEWAKLRSEYRTPTEQSGSTMYVDRYSRRAMPLPRSPAHIKRQISDRGRQYTTSRPNDSTC